MARGLWLSRRRGDRERRGICRSGNKSYQEYAQFLPGLPISGRGRSGSGWDRTSRHKEGEVPAGVFFLPKMKLMAAGGRWSKTTTCFLGSGRRLRFGAGKRDSEESSFLWGIGNWGLGSLLETEGLFRCEGRGQNELFLKLGSLAWTRFRQRRVPEHRTEYCSSFPLWVPPGQRFFFFLPDIFIGQGWGKMSSFPL